MKKPRVSIIMATKNRARLIERALKSVHEQSFSDWELIIVDDGSQDETPQILSKMAETDERIKVLRNEKSQGISKAHNRALNQAAGEFVAVIDDDDAWATPDKLRKQVDFLTDKPDYVAVGGGMIILGMEGRERYRFLKPETDEAIRKTMLLANPIAHTTAMYRLSAAKKVGGYDEASAFAGDRSLFLKLGTVGKLHNLPEYLAYYTLGGQNSSTKYQREHLGASLHYMIKYRNGYPNFLPAFFVNSGIYAYSWLPSSIRNFANSRLMFWKRKIFDRL